MAKLETSIIQSSLILFKPTHWIYSNPHNLVPIIKLQRRQIIYSYSKMSKVIISSWIKIKWIHFKTLRSANKKLRLFQAECIWNKRRIWKRNTPQRPSMKTSENISASNRHIWVTKYRNLSIMVIKKRLSPPSALKIN